MQPKRPLNPVPSRGAAARRRRQRAKGDGLAAHTAELMAANVTTATTGSLTGAAVGAATGSIAGPPGAVAGAIIGGAIGAVAGAAIGADQDEKALRDEELDRELGVIGGDATASTDGTERSARGPSEPPGPDRD